MLQDRLPVAPWTAAHTLRLPGTVPIGLEDWLHADEVFAAQMALRDRLIAERPGDVLAAPAGCRAAAEELVEHVLGRLAGRPGYVRTAEALRRPDGVEVPLAGEPLAVAGRLVQEDLLILEKPEGGDEHVLTGGVLCFPSNWRLGQKLGRGLVRIHLPVEVYDAGIARRVQRLFDNLRPETPLMRANLLAYGTAELFNPRDEFDRHRPTLPAPYLRVERQVLLRLPVTGAVVFSIHTYMVRPEALPPEARAALAAARPGVFA